MKRLLLLRAGSILLQIVLLLTIAPQQGYGEMRPVLKKTVGIPPYSIIEDLLRENSDKFSDKEVPQKASTFIHTAPQITWLTDMDQRLHADLIRGKTGPAFLEIRNPGGQVSLSAGALDYGVLQLTTPLLLITVGSDNESLRLIQKNRNSLSASLRDDLLKIVPSEAESAGQGKDKQDERADFLLAAEKHIDRQVDEAVRRYRDRVASGRLVIVGGIIDLANGYGLGAGRLFIININNETSPGKLQAMHHTTRLDHNLRRAVGRVRPIFSTENVPTTGVPHN